MVLQGTWFWVYTIVYHRHLDMLLLSNCRKKCYIKKTKVSSSQELSDCILYTWGKNGKTFHQLISEGLKNIRWNITGYSDDFISPELKTSKALGHLHDFITVTWTITCSVYRHTVVVGARLGCGLAYVFHFDSLETTVFYWMLLDPKGLKQSRIVNISVDCRSTGHILIS